MSDSTRVQFGDARLPERFWSKVYPCPVTGCWLWGARLDRDGYAERVWLDGKRWRPHRLTVSVLVGPIPDGLEVDHLCRVRYCVNPEHLEPVTGKVNQWRGVGTFADIHGRKTHCPQGHPYSPENTFMTGPKKSLRACRECYRAKSRQYWHEIRKHAAPVPVKWHRRTDNCKNGHPLTEENVYRERSNGAQKCRTCRREAMARYKARHGITSR